MFEQAWINVKEKLPNDYHEVLAYIERTAWLRSGERTRKKELAIAWQCEGDWHVDGVTGVVALYWMPLPEPPKEVTPDA